MWSWYLINKDASFQVCLSVPGFKPTMFCFSDNECHDSLLEWHLNVGYFVAMTWNLWYFMFIMTVKPCFIVMTFNPRCFPVLALNWQCEDIWCEDNYPLIFCYDDVKSAMICGNDTKLMRCFANYITRATFSSIPNHHHVIFGLKPMMRKSVCNDWLFTICYWQYMVQGLFIADFVLCECESVEDTEHFTH